MELGPDVPREITFTIIDPAAAPGEYLSAEEPGPYVSLEDPSDDLAFMAGAGEVVIAWPEIQVLYRYPLGTCGPTLLENALGGWVFTERAPDGARFTRADVARAVAARYKLIYDEEAASSAEPESLIPGMYNRCRTVGKYEIWGHCLGDLMLHTVSLDEARGIYRLGVDS